MAGKRPRANQKPHLRNKKQPAGGNAADTVPQMNFCWRVNRVDWNGPWGWADVEIGELFGDIIPKLHEFETMKWSEIEGKNNHFINLHDCITEAQARAREINIDEDAMFSLRLTGQKRVWGVRDLATMRIVWWDPEHTVCPSLKKHT